MAERLTEVGMFIDTPVYKIKNGKKSEAVDKLAHLEDIMERLGINFVEDLEDEIKSLRVDKYIYKKDRDTWQKACEFLAYKYAEEYFDGRDIEHCFNANKRDKFVKENINYFYQQAKKEGNDERN